MPYKLTVLGRTFNTEDLTVGEAEQLEAELNVSWLMMNPKISIGHCRAIIAKFLAREMSPEAANEKIRAVTVPEMAAGIEHVEDSKPTIYEDGIPKATGGAQINGSSGAPNDSAGLPT